MSWGALHPWGSSRPWGALGGGVSTPVQPGPTTIRQAVLRRLWDSPALAAIVGDRIDAVATPQGMERPAITVVIPTTSHGHHLGGSDGSAVARVQINAWAWTQGECDQAADAIRRRFDGFVGWIGSVEIMGARLRDTADLPEPPATAQDSHLYRTMMDYTVHHRVPIPDHLED